jgi:nucleoside-diphosphate-sugar epimerase
VRVAITGAAGGIGRRLTGALAATDELVLVDSVRPEEATVYDPASPTGRAAAPITADWPYHVADISDRAALDAAFRGVDAVVHLAGWVTGEWENARSIMATNVLGTFTVYEAARDAGVRRVVAASSINAFGTFYWRVSGVPVLRDGLPLREDSPRVPEDPYSLSKGVTEDIGATFCRAFGMESVSLRFSGVWSAEKYESVLTAGLDPVEHWDDALWTWVHVDDVVSGLVQAVRAPGVVPGAITLAAADTTAADDSIDLIRRFRPELEHRLTEPLVGRASLVSIARARLVLGYEPAHRLDAAAAITRSTR